MDCTDCHNRATHIFKMPGAALNEALEAGRIDTGLPFIKAAGLVALEGAVETEDGAAYIASAIDEFYAENHPETAAEQGEALDAAISAVQAIYRRNIFPKMNIGWGTYPNHNGHTESEGCFRCHSDSHSSLDGAHVISQDCTACHNVLAWDEENPDILDMLGLQ